MQDRPAAVLTRADPPVFTAVERVGRRHAIDAVPVAVATVGDMAVTAWGDGKLRCFRPEQEPVDVPVHRNAILSMAVEPSGTILTGGDDGRFCRVASNGVTELAAFPRKWVDHVAAGGGVVACSVGRDVHLWDRDRREVLETPSTVGGLAFDARGGRLAVAHYGGVTLWSRERRGWKRSLLRWAGSHTGVTFSPNDRFLMTRMQENALHGWRMRDRADLRMSGYPSKVKGWAWAGQRPWLATTGAEDAILWPFDGAHGPMGRGPTQLGWGGRDLVTAISAVPGHDAVVAGYATGAVIFYGIDEMAKPRAVCRPTGAPTVLLAVTAPSGWALLADEAGTTLWTPLRAPASS